MSEAFTVARSTWRVHVRTWVSLGLLAGLGAGAVMAAATGARRTDTAYTRFNRAYAGADVVIEPPFGDTFADIPIDDIRKLPEVVVAGRYVGAESLGGIEIAAPEAPAGVEVDRVRLLHGRLPTAVGEIAVGFDMARRRHLHIGSRLDVVLAPTGSAAEQGGPTTSGSPPLTLRVVGIEAAPGEFPPHISSNSTESVRVSLATIAAISDKTDVLAETLVRLRHGDADVPAFVDQLHQLAGDKVVITTIRSQRSANVVRSMHLQAVALWLIAALLVVVVGGVLAQQLVRQAAIDAGDHSTLKALGSTRRQLWTAGLLRAGAAALLAGLTGAVLAVAASPLMPIGTARVAEPHRGLRFDWPVLAVGVLATVVFVVVTAAVPLWRATSVRSFGVAPVIRRSRPPAATRIVGGAALPPAMTVGIRMALQRGHGRTAVPVVSSLVSVIIAITALVGAVTFGANLDHLLSAPRLYGWNWDARITANAADVDAAELLRLIGDDPRIQAVATVDTPPLSSGGHGFDAYALAQVKGRVEPVVLEGRSPSAPDEIALGSDTMRQLKTHVGGTIPVRISAVDGPERQLRVVGRIVLAPQSDTARLGQGAVIDGSAELPMAPPGIEIPAPSDLVIRFAPGVDQRQVAADLSQRLGPDISVGPPQRPADLVNFGQVQRLPLFLAILLAVLGAATLAHALLTSIRQRRRDLSVLKTLGFSSRQVRATVAWQATAFVGVAVVVGVPLGLVAGRVAWRSFIDHLGGVPEAVFPSVAVLLIVPAAIVVANLIAMVPGAIAGRLRPALVLRAD